ncbi:MAG: M56 family metallopeptidase [Lachnospiraceae bacterium]|nr:M56 family metallopeptidase [Lachnospiraceae bacterium]
MQGAALFFNGLYGFIEFTGVYYSTILGFCVIISVFVLGMIMILRGTLFARSVFGKGALWCLLIPVVFCGKLHAFFMTDLGIRLFYWWYILCNKRWIGAVYFSGMIVAGVVIFTGRKRLYDSVNRLYDSGVYSSDHMIKEFPGQVSSFCTGCLRPVIVIPEDMSGDHSNIVIKHEETHIKLGHLWIMLAYDLLRIFLWPNPFLHLCVGYIKHDLEDICDTVTIQQNGIDVYDYGETIIACAGDRILTRKRFGCDSGMSFAWDDSYKSLKKRLERIVDRKTYNEKVLILGAMAITLTIAVALVMIASNSYKRVNYYDNISAICYAGDTEKIYTDYDNSIVTAFDSDHIYIDGAALLKEYPAAESGEEWFYFSVGGYYKIPGIGGSAGWGELDAGELRADIIKIPNHTETDIWNRIIMWL